MGLLIGFIFHVLAIYFGAQMAQLEYVDVWRCVVVALISYIAMVVIALPMALLIVVPIVNLFLGPLILGVGTAIAAKIVLSCDWKPAWTVGITVAVLNLLIGWVFSGCA